ncbi:MAG: hypothetical protein Q4C53_06105 [Clostridia bacterium]|nr:hypothetical protein [Clostridia bacterium]
MNKTLKHVHEVVADNIALVLNIIGWVSVVSGVILGLLLGVTAKGAGLVIFIGCTIGGLIPGALFLGFAKVIELLTAIANKGTANGSNGETGASEKQSGSAGDYLPEL